MVADRDGVHGDVVVAAIRAAGGRAAFVGVDVAEPHQIRSMVDAVEEEFGRLDVAVNNAGTPGTYKPFSDQLLDDWQRTLAVNLIGGFLMGLLVGTLARMQVPGENWRLLIGVGVLGGYTTFSAFSLDVVNMMQRGDLTTAALYILFSTVGAIAALFAGLALVRVAAA